MHPAIHVLNGPNLNRLGRREPEISGSTTLAEVEAMCREVAGPRALVFRQTNAEHQLVDWIHEAIDEPAAAVIINPAGLTFSSVPVMDALKMSPGPVIELHITNFHRHNAIYHRSLVSTVLTAVIAGLGPQGYRSAVETACRIVGSGGDRPARPCQRRGEIRPVGRREIAPRRAGALTANRARLMQAIIIQTSFRGV